MRAFTYSRFSTDRQTEASIIDQQRACHAYAARAGWTITRDYSDEGISGAAFGNRPGATEVLVQLEAGDVLLVADLSRLTRSQELAPLMDRIRFRGARVIGVLDNFDSASPQARMQAGLSGIMSDELRAAIASRVHLALESRAITSRATGGKTYGFDNAGKLIESEAEIVREIFCRYADGESQISICTDLNIRDIPSPGAAWDRKQRRQDGRWMPSAIHALVRNERYAGKVIWNRSRWVKDPDSGARVRRERPESEWIVREGPTLVGPEIWAQAQARASERVTSYRSRKGGMPRYLLSGILKCGICGGSFIVTGNKGSHYYCGTHRNGGRAACSMREGVRRDVAEQVILDPILGGLLSPEAVQFTVSLMREQLRGWRVDTITGQSPAMRAIDEEIADIQALIDARPNRSEALRVALEHLHERRKALQRTAWRAASDAPVEEDLAERAYREAVSRLRDGILGSLGAARRLLKEILGDVRVQYTPGGWHLEAVIGINPVPLLREAGIAWVGSGGTLPTQAMTLPLRRSA